MMRLVIGLSAFPVLFVIGASLFLMEPALVCLCGIASAGLSVTIASALIGFARSRGERFWAIVLSAVCCLGVIVSVSVLNWPLRAAYLWSRLSLDELAQKARTGQPLTRPTRVGIFTIVETQIGRHGVVCLWVDADPGGKMGFVQCEPEHVPFSLCSSLSMDRSWQFIKED